MTEARPSLVNEPLVSTSVEAVERIAHLDEVAFIGDGAIANADVIREVGRESRAAGKSNGAFCIEQATGRLQIESRGWLI